MKTCQLFLVALFLSCASAYAKASDAGFEQRKQLLLDAIADNYNPPSKRIGDPEKYYWPKVIARMAKYGKEDQWSNDILAEFRDHAPFHFTLVGLARIFALFPDAPAMDKYQMEFLQAVWDRTDSYNSWSAEGTENHINMTRTSGYIYAKESEDFPQFPDAAVRAEQMKDWLKYFSKNCYEVGTGEWNSSTYAVYHIIGWLNLFDYAQDEEVKAMARAVLDYYAMELAMNYTNGVMGGAEMRGGLKTKIGDGTGYLAWLWFGDAPLEPSGDDFFVGNQYIQSIHGVTSSYRPPEVLVDYAQKKNRKPEFYKISTGDYLQSSPGFVKRTFYVEDDYTLGTATHKFGGYSGASSQIINWKMVARGGENAMVNIISGNGYYTANNEGHLRDPYTQFAQHNNVVFQLTRVPKNHEEHKTAVDNILSKWNRDWYADFKARFPMDGFRKDVVTKVRLSDKGNSSFLLLPTQGKTETEGSTIYLDLGTTYAAISVVGGPVSKELSSGEDFTRYVVSADFGELCGFVVEMGSEQENGSYQKFKNQHGKKQKIKLNQEKLAYTSARGDKLEFEYQIAGTFKEPIVDWGYGTKDQHMIIKSPPYLQPAWPSGPGYGKVPTLTVNGKAMAYESDWITIDGPSINLSEGVLTIEYKGKSYQVDYKKKTPKFKS